VARFWNAKYPWAAQSRNGLKAGLKQEDIDAIDARASLPTENKLTLLASGSPRNCSTPKN
jgi:hypothetical protein